MSLLNGHISTDRLGISLRCSRTAFELKKSKIRHCRWTASFCPLTVVRDGIQLQLEAANIGQVKVLLFRRNARHKTINGKWHLCNAACDNWSVRSERIALHAVSETILATLLTSEQRRCFASIAKAPIEFGCAAEWLLFLTAVAAKRFRKLLSLKLRFRVATVRTQCAVSHVLGYERKGKCCLYTDGECNRK